MRNYLVMGILFVWLGPAGANFATATPNIVLGIEDGSEDAAVILDVANSTSLSYLVDKVRLNSAGADNILRYRLDHKLFDSLTELEQIPYLGRDGFESLLQYGRQNGFFLAINDPFNEKSCNGALMNWHQAMMRIKSGDNSAPLGRYEIRERRRNCDRLLGCGQWALVPVDQFDSSSIGQATLKAASSDVNLQLSTPIVRAQNGEPTEYRMECQGNGETKFECGLPTYSIMVREMSTFHNGRRLTSYPSQRKAEFHMTTDKTEVIWRGVLTNECLRLHWHSPLNRRENSNWLEIDRVLFGKF